MIQNFEDFCLELNSCGFSMGGGNAKGIFALIGYDWLNQDMLDTPVKWLWFEIPELDADESYENIRQQILLLNPMAEEKTIRKFILGRS